ncbi:hypothetical protein FS837_006773 [Tulasnella sp. UAMH 9824]|nr:hypothetical protein FS837_006773 [Tulasnella sp. UAMH 9824]
MSLPPILYKVFKTPLPYKQTLALQHQIHQLQLSRRKSGADYPDVLLLLQHRPTYTGGRRQNAQDLSAEESRLTGIGADWVPTDRGGETTFHGPGQIVGYPLLDLGRMKMPVRTYVCRLEKLMQRQVAEHGLKHVQSEHTGLFMSPTRKLGSIGVQVRHRLTTHGFAFNVTEEPLPWFNQVVACGLVDVKATSISWAVSELVPSRSGAESGITVSGEMDRTLRIFAELMERDMQKVEDGQDDELLSAVTELEDVAAKAGDWPPQPLVR